MFSDAAPPPAKKLSTRRFTTAPPATAPVEVAEKKLHSASESDPEPASSAEQVEQEAPDWDSEGESRQDSNNSLPGNASSSEGCNSAVHWPDALSKFPA